MINISSYIKKSLSVIFLFFVLLSIGIPLVSFLKEQNILEEKARLIVGIPIRLVIICFALFYMNKNNLLEFAGLQKSFKVSNMQAIILPLVFIIMGISSNWNSYSESNIKLLTLFIFSVITVALAEELIFRGTILPFFILHFNKSKHGILNASLLSSAFFAIIHYANLYREPDNFIGITHQVFFAFSVGVFFSGLLLRTRNIIVPCVIHALINFAFGANQIQIQQKENLVTSADKAMEWTSLLITSLLFLLICLSAVFMIKKSDKKWIYTNLKI